MSETIESHMSHGGDSAKFKLYSVAELLDLPPSDWLIEDVTETGKVAVLYGPSAGGKSFVALDMAMSVATGRSWHGHDVRRGKVVYAVGEGTTGVRRRVDAWMRRYGAEKTEQAFFLLEAPQIANASDLKGLKASVVEDDSQPVLIVLDTLARCFVDGDENSAQDVGRFVEGCRQLQKQTNATVLIVHHTGKQKANKPMAERGSSALRAAADVMIGLSRTGNRIKITNDKQKDAAEFTPVTLLLETIELGTDPAGKVTTSCVLMHASEQNNSSSNEVPGLNSSTSRALTVLAAMGSATSGAWRKALTTSKGGPVASKTFQNWRTALVDTGLVEPDPDNPKRYRLTASGAGNAIAVPTAKKNAA